MDYSIDTDEDTIDLSKYSIEDSCLWLLCRLRVDQYHTNPYTLPFCSYVISWYKAVPLTCIIMAQNPYPQNVYPPIAAAMSYSTELAQAQVKKSVYKVPIPPTVQILANDLYINAGIHKQDTISILKNGWALVDKGILLVNEGVFTRGNDPEYYDESSNQCNVIIRLLRETEQYGKRTVDIYALGEAGKKMASNLCSWYKSSIVRLSKHSATHPAALSRRFEDFNHPDCHLNTPSFSKSLARHFSNHVAYMYTMAKKSDVDVKIQRYADILRSSSYQFQDLEKVQREFNVVTKEIATMDYSDIEKVKETFNKLSIAGENLVFRTNLASSALSNIQRLGEGMSGYVTKPGPSLQNPSEMSLSQHTGQEGHSAQHVSTQPVKLSLSKSKSSVPRTDTSSFTQVSRAPSVQSVESSNTPTKLKLTKSSKSTNSTPNRKEYEDRTTKLVSKSNTSTSISDIASEPISESTSQHTEVEEPRTRSSLSAHFRKMNLTRESKKSEPSGKQKKEQTADTQYKLTKDQRNQLSAVEAVVQAHKEDYMDDTECNENLELIQHDISHMTKYNTIVLDLVSAIDTDMKEDPKFSFVDWAIDDSKSCATYTKCREIFKF